MAPPFAFPCGDTANADGVVAVTTTLDAHILMAGYRNGLFPWTSEPFVWFCPQWRAVLCPKKAHFARNLPKLCRRANFLISVDRAFADVMAGCRHAQRHDETAPSWITPAFERAYGALHRLGHAHSIEVWKDGALVGGLYGVSNGQIFSAESMFSSVSNASKAALYQLCLWHRALNIALIDAQVLNAHTARFGAFEVARATYLDWVQQQRRWGQAAQAWPKGLVARFGCASGGDQSK